MHDLDDMMSFARAYSNLGWAVQQQLDDLLSGDADDINPAALSMIEKELGGRSEYLDTLIEEARK